MQSTQEIAELMLDANRNTLLGLDLKVSIATLGVGIGAMTAGVFGMNVSTMGGPNMNTPKLIDVHDLLVDVSFRARRLGILHRYRVCCCCVHPR
jgi:magnesium transporter